LDILPHSYPRIFRDHQRHFCRDHICAITGTIDASISAALTGQFSAWKICKFAALIYASVAGYIG
jgi:hypothetical protein